MIFFYNFFVERQNEVLTKILQVILIDIYKEANLKYMVVFLQRCRLKPYI